MLPAHFSTRGCLEGQPFFSEFSNSILLAARPRNMIGIVACATLARDTDPSGATYENHQDQTLHP